MRRRFYSIVLILVLSLLPGVAAAERSAVIGPVHIVSIDSGQVVPGQALRVSDGRIEAVGTFGELAADPDTEVIDGQNGYLIPGLAEMHAHVPSTTVRTSPIVAAAG